MAGKPVFVLLLIVAVAFAQTTDYCSITCQEGTHIACNAQKCTLGSNCNGKSAEFYDFTQSDIDYWLKIDNERRNQVASGSLNNFDSASKMLRTTWSNELATVAAYNVQRCTFGDDQCRATPNFPEAGENVGSRFTSPQWLSPQDAIQGVHDDWFNEYTRATMAQINDFPDPQPTGNQEIGHFTQVVRDVSGQFGCAAVKYIENGNNTWYMACVYAHYNTKRSNVYTAGTPCSECPNGCDTEYTSLCKPTTTSDSATTICGGSNSTSSSGGASDASSGGSSSSTSGGSSSSTSGGSSGSNGQSSNSQCGNCKKSKCCKSQKSKKRTIKTKNGKVTITESKVKGSKSSGSKRSGSKRRSGGRKSFKGRKSLQ